MGQSGSLPTRLKGHKVSEIQLETGLTPVVVRKLYQEFRVLAEASPESKTTITLEQMQTVFAQARCKVEPAVLSSLFKLFDRDDSGLVDFREFISGLAVISSPNLDDSLQMVFDCYDLKGDSWITQKEMVTCLLAMGTALELEQLSGHEQDNPDQRKAEIENWVTQMFLEFDVLQNGALQFDEFKAAVKSHPQLVRVIQTFGAQTLQALTDTKSS
eukprot:NODE_1523_length_828_cov_53.106990_g1475_i0.p1 GENE.NODE_1523_length_828_cov_53.106990_g1475_i0~~NODE_1523_length_828_cov_53.106990_g1475_i0.p1  ORF type:complete len:215 (+),score=35.69 NODE_1523_length_828_cov_53.106990_g1475_i0:82-726(+)